MIHIKGTAWEWLVSYWAKGEAEIRQGAELKKKKKRAKEFAERITEGGIFQAGAAEWSRDRSELSGVPGVPLHNWVLPEQQQTEEKKKRQRMAADEQVEPVTYS